jgi:outer membrane protein assembly factor BamB
MMRRSNLAVTGVLCALWLFPTVPRAAASPDPTMRPVPAWPQFRGPAGSGVSLDGNIPVHFGPSSNLVWKTALPSGHSSPCIWGERIFLTGFENSELQTLCLDRANGRILWRRAVPPGRIERSGRLSNPASSTPAADGQRVYVYFGAFGLVCYDSEGAEQWRKPLPTPLTQHGASSSPVLSGPLLLLVCDQDEGSHLLAVRKSDGTTAWRVERPEFRRGFSTPLVCRVGGRDQALVAGTLRLVAYDLETGREEWSAGGLPNEMCSTPVWADNLIFVAGWTPGAGVPRLPSFQSLLEKNDRNGDGKLAREEAPDGPARAQFAYIDANKDGVLSREEWETMAEIFARSENALLAIRPGGKGDVTATHVVWRQKRGLPYVPSPLVYQGRVSLIKNGGLVSCFKTTDGAALFQEERVGVLGDYYSSPVAAGNKVCLASQQGVLTILVAGDQLNVLARNNLGEEVLATPAIIGNTLYVRTAGHLFAFSEPSKAGP